MTAMRKILIAILILLSALPPALRAQLFSFEVGICGGPGHPLKPAYFRNFYRSSGVFGARFNLVFSERSSVEFDFASVSFRFDAGKYAAALGAPEGSGFTAEGGRIRIDVSTLSYKRFLIPEETGLGIYALTGFGLDYIVANPISVTEKTAGQSAPAFRTVVTVKDGYFPSLSAGIGFTVGLSEKAGAFCEARLHYVLSAAGRDIVTDAKAGGFMDFWTPTAGLKYRF
jgi:hypothetical protein